MSRAARERYEAGTDLLLPLLRKTNDAPEVALTVTRALLLMKKYDSAAQLLEPYAAHREDDPELYYLLGLSYQNAAEKNIQVMIDTDPQSYSLRQLMGNTYLAQERYEAAAKEYQLALDLQPDNSDLCSGPAIFMVDSTRSNPLIICMLSCFSTEFVRKTPESTMPTQKPPRIPLPKGWPSHVKSGILHIISLGSVNTNGHNHVTMRRWNSRKLNTNGSRHTCRCSAATSAFRTSRCSTPSCMSPSMAANGAGYPHGLATGTPSTPA